MKGNKGKNRPTAERWRLYTRSRSHGHSRRSRGEERHDFYGDPPKLVLEHIALREVVIDLREVAEPVVAEPFYPRENIGTVTVTFEGPLTPEVVPATKRRQPKLLPWEGGDKPWSGRSRSFVYA